jgi:hypothetical protein
MATTPRVQPAIHPAHAAAPARDALIRGAIVGLAVSTGAIHLTLGGLLFTLNGLGYFVAAAAMVAPIAPAARFRWLVRLGLVGYATTTIIGWVLMGPRYETAYIAKAIEVALIALLAIDFRRVDGNPVAVARRELGELRVALRAATRR